MTIFQMNFLVFLDVKCYNPIEGSDFLLSDNIRKYRKSKQMSQDELAEKLEVTRQSISLWETGQTQPSLDNIVALAKLFDVSTDALLTDNEQAPTDTDAVVSQSEKPANKKPAMIIAVCFAVVLAVVLSSLLWKNRDPADSDTQTPAMPNVAEPVDAPESDFQSDENNEDETVFNEVENGEEDIQSQVPDKTEEKVPDSDKKAENAPVQNEAQKGEDKGQSEAAQKPATDIKEPEKTEEKAPVADNKTEKAPVQNEASKGEDKGQKDVTQEPSEDVEAAEKPQETVAETPEKPQEDVKTPEKSEEAVKAPEQTQTVVEAPVSNKGKDLFGYLKDFVVQNGTLNGDYCYYSKSADNYGGYADEQFSLYYWGDTDKIEFCLHSVLDETFSINFYLYVPKKHSGNYEYISSYYYRDNGEPLYEARGVIKGAEFTKSYPLSCDSYYGSADVQNDFMEMSRQGICDAIECLKNFVTVENLEYSFSDFGFVKF